MWMLQMLRVLLASESHALRYASDGQEGKDLFSAPNDGGLGLT